MPKKKSVTWSTPLANGDAAIKSLSQSQSLYDVDSVEPAFNSPPFNTQISSTIPRSEAKSKHEPGQPMQVRVNADSLQIGNVSITFQRTLRIPDDGRQYPLPPGLGRFPLRRVEDYGQSVPAAWREHGGVFLPIYQREAMWLQFSGAHWRPNALKVAIGKINALSGRAYSQNLTAEDKDYMVVPDQSWLDGINSGADTIKQFVAMPLGMGYTVEGQLTGEEKYGGLQLCVFEPKVGKFPDTPPVREDWGRRHRGSTCFGFGQGEAHTLYASASLSSLRSHSHSASKLSAESFIGQEMGLAAGGSMRQKIYADGHGLDTWDQSNCARVYVHLVNSEMWQKITGEALPSSPVSAATYASHGYPWFDLYDEGVIGIDGPNEFAAVKTVKEMDANKGFSPMQDDASVEVAVIKKLPLSLSQKEVGVVEDGQW